MHVVVTHICTVIFFKNYIIAVFCYAEGYREEALKKAMEAQFNRSPSTKWLACTTRSLLGWSLIKVQNMLLTSVNCACVCTNTHEQLQVEVISFGSTVLRIRKRPLWVIVFAPHLMAWSPKRKQLLGRLFALDRCPVATTVMLKVMARKR